MSTSMLQKVKICSVGLLLALGLFTLSQAKQQASQFKVLAFYTPYAQMGDKAHSAYSLEANTWFPTVAAANGFTYESTTNWGDLNATKLAGYKVIMFFDNYPSGSSQRTAFENYIKNGGGWIGFHVCMFNMSPDYLINWSFYTSTLVGTDLYKNNTWAPTTAVLAVEDTSYVITKGFPIKFTGPVNEWYAWTGNVKGNANLKVLCSIHSDSYPLGTGSGSGGSSEIWQNTGEYRPMIWINKNYKAMYSNIGHDSVNYATGVGISKTFRCALYDTIIVRAIKYFAGVTTSLDGKDASVSKSSGFNTMADVKVDQKIISVSIPDAENFNVSIVDLKGRVMYSGTGRDGVCRIQRNGLVRGSYIVKIESDAIVATREMLIDE